MLVKVRRGLLIGACIFAALALFFPLSEAQAPGLPVQMGPSGGFAVIIALVALLSIRLPQHFPVLLCSEVVGIGGLWTLRAFIPLIGSNIGNGFWLLVIAASLLCFACVIGFVQLQSIASSVLRWILAGFVCAAWAISLWILLFTIAAASVGIGL